MIPRLILAPRGINMPPPFNANPGNVPPASIKGCLVFLDASWTNETYRFTPLFSVVVAISTKSGCKASAVVILFHFLETGRVGFVRTPVTHGFPGVDRQPAPTCGRN